MRNKSSQKKEKRAKRAMRGRVPKTLEQELRALDHHIYLLRNNLRHINEDIAHLKQISGELRVLVCDDMFSEGFLWRLTNEMNASDVLHLQMFGKLNLDHPIMPCPRIAFVSMQRAGKGDPRIPSNYYSFRDIIKYHEAIFVLGKGVTHEQLIKTVAEQMGSAHEDEAIDLRLDELDKVNIGGVKLYVQILCFDAELALQIGERVLEKAEAELAFKRSPRLSGYGDVTVVVRLGLREVLAGRIPVFKVKSYISDVCISCFAGPESLVFKIFKERAFVGEVCATYPRNWELNSDAVFALSYSSQHRKVHTITNDISNDNGIPCNVVWIHAREFILEGIPDNRKLIYRQFVTVYDQLLSPRQCYELLKISPDLKELFEDREDERGEKTFPK